jgi:hypothetical protein
MLTLEQVRRLKEPEQGIDKPPGTSGIMAARDRLGQRIEVLDTGER